MPAFTCETCGRSFDVPQAALDKYPGWTPRRCREHSQSARRRAGAGGSPRGNGGGRGPSRRGRRAQPAGESLTLAQVLERYTAGPQDGVFTDGGAMPNPGPGGWGVVWVRDGQIVEQRHGHEPHTTNNRMELTALIEAFSMLPEDAECTVYSDSQLCVNIVNDWAAKWARAGWRRKGGPIKNLELVQRLYELTRRHPRVRVQWIAAHNGQRWNEYADALASAWTRSVL